MKRLVVRYWIKVAKNVFLAPENVVMKIISKLLFKFGSIAFLLLLNNQTYGEISLDNDTVFQKVESSGIDIYFRVFGKGTPLLILGGGPGDHSNRYLSLTKGLAKNFQCILVDQRGTGKSTPAILDSTTVSVDLTLSDFEVIRKKLGFNQWAVLGFSYGGYLTSLYAHFMPSSISKIVLLESIGLNLNAFNYFMDNITSRLSPSDKLLAEYWKDSSRIAENPQQAITEWIRAIMPGYFYDRNKSLMVSEHINESHFNFDLGHWMFKDIINRKLDLKVMEPNFSKPVLIVHGRQDPVGESVPLELFNYYEKVQLTFIEKCGHYSWVEQPQKVYSAIGKFIN